MVFLGECFLDLGEMIVAFILICALVKPSVWILPLII